MGDSRPAGALAPFRHPIFRAVWIAMLVSSFGGMIQSVGAAWMMVELGGSARMVTLVQASVSLPIVLLALVAGALADAFDKRKMMVAAQLFMLTTSAALAVMTWAGLITPWLLLTFTFLIGCGAALNGPAWQASVRAMVPREDIPTAVTLNSMGFNLARSLGPAIGGTIVAAAGAAAAFTINALSYIGLAIVLLRWQPQVQKRTLPRERLGRAIASGIRYVTMNPAISAAMLRGFVTGIGSSAVASLLPLVARDLIGGGPTVFGFLLGAFGIGAVTGAMASHRLRMAFPNEHIVRFALIGSAAGMTVCAFSTSLMLSMGALVLCGLGWVLIVSILNATVQMSSPRWVVARALSLYQMCTFGGMAAGSWIWGVVTEASSLTQALVIAAGVMLFCVALGFRFALPETEEMNLDPVDWSEPEIAVPVAPRTGPVVIAIEYLIAPDDVAEFMTAMHHRRQIRRRNGARGWTLLRDLADPEKWVERYHVPTWTEYVRHNRRFTKDEAQIGRQIRALHRGERPPVVIRMIERHTGFPADAAQGEAPMWSPPMTDPSRMS